jgi:hypothetical protein
MGKGRKREKGVLWSNGSLFPGMPNLSEKSALAICQDGRTIGSKRVDCTA